MGNEGKILNIYHRVNIYCNVSFREEKFLPFRRILPKMNIVRKKYAFMLLLELALRWKE